MASKLRAARWTSLLLVALAAPLSARAAEIGHYVPGLVNVRDLVMPADPGVYFAVYNYGYLSDRLQNARADTTDSVVLGPSGGPNLTVNVDVDLDLYALAPMLLWVSPWKVLGARYSAFVLPSFADASVGAALSTATRRGAVSSSHFDVGDLLVQPVWLGWSEKHADLSLGYGFYAPVGEYGTENLTFPLLGTRRVEKTTNIGYGYWTHQVQASAAYYPFENRATALVMAMTYENHGDKEDFDLEPGDDLTVNWGVSQYLPLTTSHELLLEVGIAGYSALQISNDRGSDRDARNVRDEVHAVGAQLGATYVPAGFVFNVHYFYEVSAEDRFQGHALGVSLAKKFW